MAKPTYPVVLASTSLTSGIIEAWPLNEGVGNAVGVVLGTILDCTGSGVSWNASPLGLKTVGTPSSATVATPAALKLYPASQPEITLLWIGQILGTYADFGICCGCSDGTYSAYSILAKTSTSHALYICGNNAKDGSISFVSGAAHTLILRQHVGIMGNTLDGAADGGTPSNNLAGGLTYGVGSKIFLGTTIGTSLQTNIRSDLLVVWNRSISDGEVTSINSDPWQLFVPVPSGANPAALLPAM